MYDIYERDLHRMNAMDFDDLLFRTVNLLELFEEVRERYTQTFRHVLVDEYQDTNHAQYRLLQLLVGGGRPPQRGGGEPGDRPTYAGPSGTATWRWSATTRNASSRARMVTMADGTAEADRGRLGRGSWSSPPTAAATSGQRMVMRRHDAREPPTGSRSQLARGRRAGEHS